MRLLVVVNLFNIFLYFVILHEYLQVQRLQLDLQLLYIYRLLLLSVRRRVLLLLNLLRLRQGLGLLRFVINVIGFIEAEDEPYCIVVVQHLKVFVQDDDALLEVIDHLLPARDFVEFLGYPIDILLCDLIFESDEVKYNK